MSTITVTAADFHAILKATLPNVAVATDIPQLHNVLLEVGQSFHEPTQLRLMAWSSDRFGVTIDEAVFEEAEEAVEFSFLIGKDSAKAASAWAKGRQRDARLRITVDVDADGVASQITLTDLLTFESATYRCGVGRFPNLRALVNRDLFSEREITRSAVTRFDPDAVARWTTRNVHRSPDGVRGRVSLAMFFPEESHKAFGAQHGDHVTAIQMPRKA